MPENFVDGNTGSGNDPVATKISDTILHQKDTKSLNMNSPGHPMPETTNNIEMHDMI